MPIKKFLKNGDINNLNLHQGFLNFGDKIVFIFAPIYFLGLGVPLSTIFIVFAFEHLLRFVFRLFSVKIIGKIGIKNGLIVGTILYLMLFPCLMLATGNNIWFYIFFILLALEDSFYWLSYHTYFARLGKSKDRGKETAARESIVAVAASIAPFISGLIIDHVGFVGAYSLSILMILLSLFPLLKVSQIEKTPIDKESIKNMDKTGFFLYIGWSFFDNAHKVVWIIFLYQLLLDYTSYGFLLTLEIVLVSILFLVLGHSVDNGNSKKILLYGNIIMICLIFYRSFFVWNIITVIISNIIAAFGTCFMKISANSTYYNISKKTDNSLSFHFLSESGWDIGGSVAYLLGFILISLDVPLSKIMLLGIFGIIIVQFVLGNHKEHSN